MHPLPFALVALLIGASSVPAAPTVPVPPGGTQIFTSGHPRTALLELYTSEGCSSCPAAEAWLSRLTDHPRLWRTIVPVAFHVDYWDRLGWRDRFASPAATHRQQDYVRAWNGNSMYTPEPVLNGKEWQPAPGTAPGELPSTASSPVAGAGPLRAVVSNGRTVQVTYRPGDHGAVPIEATVALLGFRLESQVGAGENRGRSLRHDFVALACQTKPLAATDGPERTATFELPAASPEAKRLALAVWVQAAASGPVQQATGGWLAAPMARPPL